MPVFNLVIEILRYLSKNFEDLQECFYKRREYLDKALSNINKDNLIDSINSIDDIFFDCFKLQDHKKAKAYIYIVCNNYLQQAT